MLRSGLADRDLVLTDADLDLAEALGTRRRDQGLGRRADRGGASGSGNQDLSDAVEASGVRDRRDPIALAVRDTQGATGRAGRSRDRGVRAPKLASDRRVDDLRIPSDDGKGLVVDATLPGAELRDGGIVGNVHVLLLCCFLRGQARGLMPPGR